MVKHAVKGQEITLNLGLIKLGATLDIPQDARGMVLFAHGSGSSRFSPRNTHVAGTLTDAGLGTILIDLLTREQENIDEQTLEYRFDIDLLSERVVAATDWLTSNDETKDLGIGYFGASTGAAAALVAAAQRADVIKAVVSRGGRPDLAEHALSKVLAPTLLIVGGDDYIVIDLNNYAARLLRAETELVIIPGATHLFEEPGKLDEVAEHARNWFLKYLSRDAS
jgi:dienelactone hydrolase